MEVTKDNNDLPSKLSSSAFTGTTLLACITVFLQFSKSLLFKDMNCKEKLMHNNFLQKRNIDYQ
jgi:hypothetical protein